MRAQLQKGEMVYINAGVMGLCVACLNVSLGVGAVPFIGFNNQIERKYLRDTFPEVSEYVLSCVQYLCVYCRDCNFS